MLSPLGVLFALFITFTASQVWSDNDKANSAVDHEASALRAVVILAAAFPSNTSTLATPATSDTVPGSVTWPSLVIRSVCEKPVSLASS